MYIEHQQLKKEYAKLEPMNPTMHMFKDALDRLRRMCKKRSYLMIYLSTHILTMHSKEKEFKGEECFICFKDTRTLLKRGRSVCQRARNQVIMII
jgi:hypothetical protein